MLSIQDKHDLDSNFLLRRIIANYYDNKFDLPDYKKDMRQRDEGLIKISRTEKLLSGVLSTAVSRDKNRSWSLTGGTKLVSEYGRKLHGFENGSWRNFISMASTNFYSTNVGYSAEIGFNLNGVPTTLWNFDPKRVLLNYNGHPLVYKKKSQNSGSVNFQRDEFIHGNSMPSSEEEFYGLGFCAIERSVVIAKILIGLFEYQLEKLGIAPPKGIMLVKGTNKSEFDQAIEDAEEEMRNQGAEYYRGVLALITDNVNAGIDLVGFSELPDQFDLKEFIEIVIQSYSLAFNYPVGQFWSIQSGSFGRTGEMKVQEQQATAKGELEFSLSLQEQLQQRFLPRSLTFSFDTRNDSGDLVRAEQEKLEIEKIRELYKNEEENIISRDEARMLLAKRGYIPKEWTDVNEDIVEEDLKEIRENILSNAQLVSRIASKPDEPIVRYTYGSRDEHSKFDMGSTIGWKMARYLSDYHFPSQGRLSVVFESGHDAIRKKIY